jgi:hypothetical protein
MATNERARTRIAHLGCGVGAAAVLAFVANGSPMLAARAAEPARWAAPQRLPQTAEYRYDVSVRIRAVIFSITRNGVGAARIVRGTSRDGARSYELLIGSDPARTPMGINRWGYVAETVDGSTAQLVGVMTESEEQTVAEATASVKGQAGNHRFKAILGSVDGREASALVVRAGFPENFTFRDVETVLARLPEGSPTARLRIPDGTHPGFLGAVADIVHASVETFSRSGRGPEQMRRVFVYDRGLYDLTQTSSRVLADLRLASRSYGRALDGQFEVRNRTTGDTSSFRIAYGIDGRVAEVPVRVVYRPRWWFEVELTLAE